ncbi:MAG: hypothetical protein QOJ89_3481 [bacterium]|jgi:hypothetical protein
MAAGTAVHSVSGMMQTVDRRDAMPHRTGRRVKADRVRYVRPTGTRRASAEAGTRTRS